MTENLSRQKVFIETSAHIKRFFGLQQEKDAINKLIDGKLIFSSYFILKEFRDLVTKSLIELYFFINDYPQYPPSEAFKRFKHSHSFSPRLIKMGFDLAILFLDKGLSTNRTQALFNIATAIRNIEREFIEFVDKSHMINNISCVSGIAKLQRTSNTADDFYNFINEMNCPLMCCRNIYIVKQSNILSKIIKSDLSVYEKSSYDLKKRKEFFDILLPLYKKIQLDPTTLTNDDYQHKLRDTMIAIECPRSCTLISVDRIFEILCSLVEKEYIIFSPKNTTVVKKAN